MNNQGTTKEFTMKESPKKEDTSTWAVGGGVLLGTGVGFFLLEQSPLFFLGSILAGLGVGLVITSIINASKK